MQVVDLIRDLVSKRHKDVLHRQANQDPESSLHPGGQGNSQVSVDTEAEEPSVLLVRTPKCVAMLSKEVFSNSTPRCTDTRRIKTYHKKLVYTWPRQHCPNR